MRGPVDRMTERLPPAARSLIDWVVTIAVAVGAVLAIKAWVVNPYRIPSPSMEPALHCGGAPGCLADFSDRVLANRFIYHFREPKRGEIVVFETPTRAVTICDSGFSSTFVKRLIGLPGDTWEQRKGIVFINGKRLDEPYLDGGQRDRATYPRRTIPPGQYFMMGDNRPHSCDSVERGTVPRANLIGSVFAVYWPPQRVGLR